jgi:hypothetical protein
MVNMSGNTKESIRQGEYLLDTFYARGKKGLEKVTPAPVPSCSPFSRTAATN